VIASARIREDVLSLTDQLSDIGVGVTPADEVPDKPEPTTPGDVSIHHLQQKEQLLKNIDGYLQRNFQCAMFCSHPDSIVHLSVAKENENKIFRRQYKMAEALKDATREIIIRWFKETKIIKAPTGCKFNTPLLVVPKYDKDGKIVGIRICTDIRQLNKYLLEDDRFEIPKIPDILSAFKGAKLFGEFDLKEAYNQFRVSPESQQLTAFTFENEQYMFQGCPYGIKHIPSHFQRFITHLFIDMPYVYPYIDNIVFASKDWQEHELHAKAIIERLTSVDLTIKPTSVNLGNTSIRILGHVIDQNGISIDPEKKRIILEWPKPKTGVQLASFLGLGTYLRDHVRHYADITAYLESAKKEKEIKWNDLLNEQWELVKRAFANAPYLKFPDFNNRFAFATDASNTGIGGILYQPDDEEGTITPYNIIAICSKKLTETQQRYPVYKKELWGIIYCLRKFHSYIWGRSDTIIYTDHKPLIHIFSQTNLSAALQQWLDVILDYNIEVRYRPGILHVVPDALSRMYAATYKEPQAVWGTMNNIKFVETSMKILSPSDIICKQSIQEIPQPSRIKKRYKIEGGETQYKNENDSVEILPSLNFVYENNNFYDVDDENDSVPAFIDEDEWEYEETKETGALFYAARLPYKKLRIKINSNAIVSKADELLNENENDANTEANIKMKQSSRMVVDCDNQRQQLIDKGQKMSDVCEKCSKCVKDHDGEINTETKVESRLLTPDELVALAQEKRGCTIPPENERKEIVEKAHEKGHFGKVAIYKALTSKKLWWPNMMTDIMSIVKQCRSCQEYTIYKQGFHPMKSVNATSPWDHIMVDLMQMIESSDGMNYILTVVDVFTGFIMLYALPNKNAETIAEKLWNLFSIFGPCKIIQSDNGTEFVNAIIKAMLQHEGVAHRLITAYNPKADGKVERVNQTIRQTINKMVSGVHSHWPMFLPFVQISYNDKIDELTNSTHYALMFGRKMNEFENFLETEIQDRKINMNDWLKHQEEVLSLIYPQISLRSKHVQEKYKKKLEEIRRNVLMKDLPSGTQVMIIDENYLKGKPKPNTAPKYVGKYTIVKREVNGPYVIKDDTGEIYHRKVPIDQMKVLFRPNNIPFMKDDEDIWEVERIIDYKKKQNKMKEDEYLIRWKGWSKDYDTWEPRSHIQDQNLIDIFWRKQEGTKQSKRARVRGVTTLTLKTRYVNDTLFNVADRTAQTQ
jgi:hypothetical protein